MENIEKQMQEHQKLLSKCIAKNLPLIMALQLEIEDVKQDLSIRMLKAINRFEADRCRSMSLFLKHELKFEILDIRRRHKPHGIVGVPEDLRLEIVYLDHTEEECMPVELSANDEYDLITQDALKILHDDERSIFTRKMNGERIQKKSELSLLDKALVKLTDYFERMGGYAEAST